MKRQTISVGGFGVNCSILSEGERAWIVDPGQEAARISRLLNECRLRPVAILLTHGHFDHIGGVPELLRLYPDLQLYAHPDDLKLASHPLNQLPPEYPPVGELNGLDVRAYDQLPGLRVIGTPGHTPGGVCYYFENEKLLLSGDTLFAGSVGRTDLPGGDMSQLLSSLQHLAELPDDTLVVPGHGPETTIGDEKRSNPFLC